MRRVLTLALTVVLVLAASAHAGHKDRQAELLDEVLRLSYEGVPDQIVIKQIYAMDFIFELTADDIIELRTLGVSDAVIEALIDTALEEDDDIRDAYVGLSPGFYSPWYHYPYAWAFYFDPFPSFWSYYYYPVAYDWAPYGSYGWCGGLYYYAYHRRDHHYRDDRGPMGGAYLVASELPARRVRQPAVPAAGRPGGHGGVIDRRPIRERRQRAERPRVISERRGDLRPSRSAYRAGEVRQVRTPQARPRVVPSRIVRGTREPMDVQTSRVSRPATQPRRPQPAAQPRQRRNLHDAKSPARVERPTGKRQSVRPSTRPQQVKHSARRRAPAPNVTPRRPSPRSTHARSAPAPHRSSALRSVRTMRSSHARPSVGLRSTPARPTAHRIASHRGRSK